LNFNPKDPEVGDSVTVKSAFVQNIGDGNCKSQFNVKLFINGVVVITVPVRSLPAGDSETVYFDDYKLQIDGKQYDIKVEAVYNGEEDAKGNNVEDERLEPKPGLKITTDKCTYKGDGEKVKIKVDFYTPNKKDTLLIKESCDGHIEYYNEIDLSTKTSPFTIEIPGSGIPALPVYNSKEHVISGSLQTLACRDTAEYNVEPTKAIDMIVLTQPEKLRKQFKEEDWIEILFDIQRATDDGGILLYAEEDDNVPLISSLIWVAERELKEEYCIKHLFILGGDDVIPYRHDTFDEVSISDQPYWSFATPSKIPEIRYARLPTTKSSDRSYNYIDFDRFLNKKVFDNVLKNEPKHSKTIAWTLVVSGRDLKNKDTDEYLKERSDYIKGKLNNDKDIDYLAEYALNEEGSEVEKTYDRIDVKTADLIYFLGHGDPRSISMDNDTHDSIRGTRWYKPSVNEHLQFYNDLSNDAGSSIRFRIEIPPGQSKNLPELPIVFADACDTANRAVEYEKVPLSEIFMHFNAGSYFGYGTSVSVGAADSLTRAYFDQIVVEQNLGSIFYNSIGAASTMIKNQRRPINIEQDFLNDLEYSIQFGYPKWNIDPDEDAPDYSNPL
jgi:hypothetical protein